MNIGREGTPFIIEPIDEPEPVEEPSPEPVKEPVPA